MSSWAPARDRPMLSRGLELEGGLLLADSGCDLLLETRECELIEGDVQAVPANDPVARGDVDSRRPIWVLILDLDHARRNPFPCGTLEGGEGFAVALQN